MKNIKILIISVLFFIMPLVVNADVSGVLSCNKTNIKKGDSLVCDLFVTGEELTSINESITYSKEHLTLTKIEGYNGWTSNSSSKISLSRSRATLSNTKVATIYFNVNSSSSHYNENITLSGDFNAVFNYTLLSNNNKVKNISGTCAGVICMNFSNPSDKVEKTLKKTSVKISAVLDDANAKFKDGYGPKDVNLKYGENIIKLIVVSETGEENTYTIKITRPDDRSSVNLLSSLSVGTYTLSPRFSPNTLNYEVNVKEDITKVKISAKVEDSKSSFAEGYGPREVSLNKGVNKASISVKAENGEVRTYNVTINRGMETSSNAYLKTLIIKDSNIDFNKHTFEYKINVLSNVEKLKITATPESDKATVKIEGNDLKDKKEGLVTIKVTSEDGTENTYKINVTKLQEGETLSDNTKLKSLVISGYDLDFNSNVYEYTLKIKNTNRLYITATPEDKTSVVKISGNTSLKNGSVITITVTSEDTTEKVYKINIVKDNTKIYIILLVSLISVVIIGIISKKFYDKNKQKKSYEEDLTLNKEENDRVIIK